jgi:hypothetical protein
MVLVPLMLSLAMHIGAANGASGATSHPVTLMRRPSLIAGMRRPPEPAPERATGMNSPPPPMAPTWADVRDPRYAGGAKGDGVHDDTAAFQAAITASHFVTVPPGRYRLTATLVGQPGQVSFYACCITA